MELNRTNSFIHYLSVFMITALINISLGITDTQASSRNFYSALQGLSANYVSELQPGENKVYFLSEGVKIAALVYLPENYQEGEKLPGVVVTRPASGVKEQTAGVYAQALSNLGFITLAFDPRGYGESGGLHRQNENPYDITTDTLNSVSYLMGLPQVDTDRVFNMGICMGAGYAAYATINDARVKGVAMVSPYLQMVTDNAAAVGGAENLRPFIVAPSSAARQNYFRTGEDTFQSPIVPRNEDEASAPGVTPIQVGMMEYYLPGMPGDVPNWRNEINLYGFSTALSFVPEDFANMLINVPLYMAYGSEAGTEVANEAFFAKVPGDHQKTIVEGAGHFDLYWMPEHVTRISQEIADFYNGIAVQ